MTFRKVLLLILAVTLIVHASAFVGDYVLDDASVFRSDKFDDFWEFEWWSATGRPLVRTVFAVQIEFLGRSTVASHAINLLVHLACVAGIARTLDLILRHRFGHWTSSERLLWVGSATLLWAVHPLTTTTVTYVIQRYESAASMWMIWSVFCWLRAYTEFNPADGSSDRGRVLNGPVLSGPVRAKASPSPGWWFASLLFGLFAFASKESSAGLPLILLLFDRGVLRTDWRATFHNALGPCLLLIPVALGMWVKLPVLFGERSTRSTAGFRMEGIGAVDYVLSQPIAYLRYLKLLVLPTDLVLDYGWIPSDFGSLLWLGAVGWIVLLGFVYWSWRRSPLAGAALASALLVLATTSLIPTQDMVFEHRFYLPAALIIAVACVAVASRVRTSVDLRLVKAAVGVLVVLLGYGTLMRNLDYVTHSQLLHVDLMRQPANPRTVYRIAVLDQGQDPAKQEDSLRRAIEMSERRGYFYGGADYKWRRELADLLYSQGRIDEARAVYLDTLPEHHDELQEAEVLLSLAAIASIKGEVDNANKLFERVIAMGTSITEQTETIYRQHRQRFGLDPPPGVNR